MMKKLIVPLIALLLISLSVVPVMAAGWPQFAYDAVNSSIVDAATPVSADEAALKFQVRVREAGSWDTLSNIVILDGYVYIAVGDLLQKISLEGEIVDSYQYDMPVSASPYIAGAHGMIYAFVSDGAAGQLQAVDAETMTSAWVSETIAGVESFSPITILGDDIYLTVSAFDYGIWAPAPGYVLGVAAGAPDTDIPKAFDLFYDAGLSYYWNGAVASGDYLMLSSAEGMIQIIDRETGDLSSEIDSGISIKTSLSLAEDNIYFGTASGIGRVGISDGQIDAASLIHVDLGSQVTTTPVVHNGRVYAGTGDFQGGEGFFVFNADDMSVAYKAEIPGVDSWSGADIPVAGIQSTPVLTTYYGDVSYLYFSLNAKPSGIVSLKDRNGQESAEFSTIFVPDEIDQNATMASFTADTDGTIYYTNDAGMLFAVSKVEPSDDAGEETTVEIPQTGDDDGFSAAMAALIVAVLTALVLAQTGLLKIQSRGKPDA